MIPFYGGSYDTLNLENSALCALEIGGPFDLPARAAIEVASEKPTPLRLAMDVGPRHTDAALLALSAGPESVDAARQAADINGQTAQRAASALTVLPPPQLWPVREGMSIVTSASPRSPARAGLTVRGGQPFASRHGFDVRGEPLIRAMQALAVREVGVFWPGRNSLEIGGLVDGLSRNAADVRQMDGFFILVDVTDAALANPATMGHYYPYQDITALLVAATHNLPFSSFDYEEAADKLGATLNVQLASVGDYGANTAIWNDCEFSLVLTDSEGVEHTVPLVSGGRIGGREYAIQFSRDTLSIGAVDALADKFSLCPRTPIVMFDPRYVEYSQVEVRPRDAVQTESGGIIMPLLEPYEGLTWRSAAQRAYTSYGGFSMALRPSILARLRSVMTLIDGGLSATTVGLGFAGIVTNIPDYSVARVDFTLEGGWHDGIQPLIGMFNPIYFPDAANRLFIVDARRPLPFGYTSHPVTESDYAVLAQSIPFRELFNAVLLTYQFHDYDLGLSIAEEWLPEDEQEQGTFGEADYQRTVTRQKALRVRDTFTNSIVSEAPTYFQQEVYAPFPAFDPAGGISTGPVILVHRETQQDRYQDFFKVGHTKTVETTIASGPDRSLELVTAQTETCEIVWKDDPLRPGQKIQAINRTYTEGLVYQSPDTSKRIGGDGSEQDVPQRWAILAADGANVMEDDGTVFWRAISSKTETLRVVKGSQLDVVVTERNLLTGGMKRSTSEPRVASGLINLNKFENRQVTVLMRNAASEALIGPRRPQSVNAGELPRRLALELGKRVLADGFNPPQQYRVQLPGVDLSLKRGSVIKARNRAGAYTPDLMVVGLSISGRSLGTVGHRISMTLDCVELKTAVEAASEGWALALP